MHLRIPRSRASAWFLTWVSDLCALQILVPFGLGATAGSFATCHIAGLSIQVHAKEAPPIACELMERIRAPTLQVTSTRLVSVGSSGRPIRTDLSTGRGVRCATQCHVGHLLSDDSLFAEAATRRSSERGTGMRICREGTQTGHQEILQCRPMCHGLVV